MLVQNNFLSTKIGSKKNFAQKIFRAQIAKNAEVKDELPKLLTLVQHDLVW